MHKTEIMTWSTIFAEESGDTEEGIKTQVDRENALKRTILKSIIKWKRIVDEIDGSHAGSNRSENEYRLRFYYQQQYNQLLQTEIDKLKSMRKIAKEDKQHALKIFDTHGSTIPELRTKIREMKREKISLNSSMGMLERQLDKESMEFCKVRQMCDVILNDVLLQHKIKVERQEQVDKEYFLKLRRNLNITLYGAGSDSISCLGLAASRSAVSSRSLASRSSKTNGSVQAKGMQSSKKLSKPKTSIKSGVKGNRNSDKILISRPLSVTRTEISEESQSICSEDFSQTKSSTQPVPEIETTKAEPKTIRKAFNVLRVINAFKHSKKQSNNGSEIECIEDERNSMLKTMIKTKKESMTLLEQNDLPSQRASVRKLPPIPNRKNSDSVFKQNILQNARVTDSKISNRISSRKPKPGNLPSMKKTKTMSKNNLGVDPKKATKRGVLKNT
ncbi:hypothetical protein LOTGIDRAFT_166384 [Lottia gigantea]|uniref:Uncharacterized protein n=1 Tax=Lottia gigantea TaxID=225164 RepID=V3ZXZ8_LOTGI|nr:hypothetical protein LOTGIDRAFT_166384 [Lottia gigantea]ESO87505.1 hypothetical protein LOTGIDRAFT_166384 [Lottia gigantea]